MKQVQDVIERLWDFIDKLDINTFGKDDSRVNLARTCSVCFVNASGDSFPLMCREVLG